MYDNSHDCVHRSESLYILQSLGRWSRKGPSMTLSTAGAFQTCVQDSSSIRLVCLPLPPRTNLCSAVFSILSQPLATWHLRARCVCSSCQTEAKAILAKLCKLIGKQRPGFTSFRENTTNVEHTFGTCVPPQRKHPPRSGGTRRAGRPQFKAHNTRRS